MSDAGDYYSNYRGGVSPYEYHVQEGAKIREYAIANARMKLIRERMEECVRTEGVNRFLNCKELREQYYELVVDKYNGMIFPPGEQPVSRKVPGLITDFKRSV